MSVRFWNPQTARRALMIDRESARSICAHSGSAVGMNGP
jgi:hypothetical protein